MKPYFLYILECTNGAYYTGITTEPERRWQQHVAGTAAKYTRSFPPTRMLALWEVAADRAIAQQLESKVKKLSRNNKEVIVQQPQQLAEFIVDVEIKPITLQGCRSNELSSVDPQRE